MAKTTVSAGQARHGKSLARRTTPCSCRLRGPNWLQPMLLTVRRLRGIIRLSTPRYPAQRSRAGAPTRTARRADGGIFRKHIDRAGDDPTARWTAFRDLDPALATPDVVGADF